MPSLYRLAPRRFTTRLHEKGSGFIGVIRDHHHARWYRTVLTYPTKGTARKALDDALEHLGKSQFDPTVEVFDGDV